MGEQQQQGHPITYIGVHDRTPAMRVLYVSSNTRQALLYDLDEFVGRSALEFIAETKRTDDITEHLGSYSDDNIMITSAFSKRKDGSPLFTRSVAFACGNVVVHLSTCYPGFPIDEPIDHLTMQRYKWLLNGDNSNEEEKQRGVYNRSGEKEQQASSDKSAGNRPSSSSKSAGKSVYRSAADLIRKTHQACFVCEALETNSLGAKYGTRTIFVTDSINRILNVDSCDLQGVPFLSLVAVDDIPKAIYLLEKALYGGVLAIERLRLLVNPQKDVALENPECALVEFVAMGSDEGIIMLCQLVAQRGSGCTNGGNTGYLSLEDMISSDPWTSDYA